MRKFSFLYVFVALMFLTAAGGTVWGQTVTLISPTTVENDQVGRGAEQGGSQDHPLLLAVGELIDVMVPDLLQTGRGDRLFHSQPL